jgi:TolA-binding protein
MRKALFCVLLLTGCQKDELSESQRDEVQELIDDNQTGSYNETEQENRLDDLEKRIDDMEFQQAIK